MSWQSHKVSKLTQIWSLTQFLTLVFDLTSMCQFIMILCCLIIMHHLCSALHWWYSIQTMSWFNSWFKDERCFLCIHDACDYNVKNYVLSLNKFFFLILTWFNTHYELMQDSIYCSERCASAALFSHQKSLLSALYTITVLNARTLWVCFFFIFSLFHLIL